MESISELLETQLKAALEVKNEKALHNYISILVTNLIRKDDTMAMSNPASGDIRLVIEAMDRRFEAVDKRFDEMLHYMDKRFEDLIGQTNSRFTMMFFFMSAGFTILTVLMTLYRFIG